MDIKLLRYLNNTTGLPDTIDLTAAGNVLQATQFQVTDGNIDASRPAKLSADKILVSGLIDIADNVNEITGILKVINGGTGSSTALNDNRIMVSKFGKIIEMGAITGSRAIESDSSGLPVASSVTAAELAFLSGVTSAIQTQLNAKVETSLLGANSGVATLDSNGKLTGTQVPQIAITSTFVVADEAAQLALTVQEGDVAVRTDENKSYIALNADNVDMADWQVLLTPTDAVLSVAGKTGAVTLDTDDVSEATALYFTDARARTAVLEDQAFGPLWENDITHAPNKDNLFDKLTAMDTNRSGIVTEIDNIETSMGTMINDSGVYVQFSGSNYMDAATTVALALSALDGAIKTNFDAVALNTTHRGVVTGNPHAVTKAEVGLTNVDDVQQMPLTYLDTDGTMAANSNAKVPSQAAVVTYVANAVAGSSPESLDYTTALVAGQAFDANRTYAVRWGISANGEDPNKLYEADKDVHATEAPSTQWVVGFIQTTTALVADDAILSMTKVGKLTLKSGDAFIPVAGQGKPLWLQLAGVISSTLPGSGVASGSRFAMVIPAMLVVGHTSDPTACVIDVMCAAPIHQGNGIGV